MRIEIVDGQKGWPLVEALDQEVYPPAVMATVPWRNVTWAHADIRVVVSDDEGVRCHVGIFWRDGMYGGQSVRMAGIGGVMTSARVRRKGYAGSALREAARLMEQDDIDFGLLFCEEHNEKFYGTLGWNIFNGEVWTEQPEGRVRFDMMRTLCLPVRTNPTRGVIDLCGLPW
jgi:predicted acetyltransferase